jgi:membrane associated rhomboid family serine protease
VAAPSGVLYIGGHHGYSAYAKSDSNVGVIPLTDVTRRPSRVPAVTGAIIAANVVVFLLELGGGEPFVRKWSVIPADIVAGHHLVTLFSGMFLHGSWSHILGNMVFLWAFGPEIEDAMGRGRYLAFYLLGGLAASAAQIAAAPGSTVPNLGASGAIAAVMGAFLVTYPRDRIRSLLIIVIFIRVTYIPAALLIGVWFLLQFLNLGTVVQQTGGVAYAAHIGGFVFGAVTARLFERHQPVPEFTSGF